MEKLFACEKRLFKRQMAQRTSVTPMITVLPSAMTDGDVFNTQELHPCDVSASCSTPSQPSTSSSSCAEEKSEITLATVARDFPKAKRVYSQLLVDKTNKRVAPLYVVDCLSGSSKRSGTSSVKDSSCDKNNDAERGRESGRDSREESDVKNVDNRNSGQSDVDKQNRRKKRRIISEIALIVRHYEETDAFDEKEVVEKSPREESTFSLVDIDEREAKSLADTDYACEQAADRLVAMCRELIDRQHAVAVVRTIIHTKTQFLPRIVAAAEKAQAANAAEGKQLVLTRRAVLLRALIDSAAFPFLQFPSSSGEREAGVILVNFTPFSSFSAYSSSSSLAFAFPAATLAATIKTSINLQILLNVVGMLLELSNPQHDLAKLVDIAHSKTHHDALGTTWTMTELGLSLLRPSLRSWSDYRQSFSMK